ncbi:PilZ domain-containing protein [Vreelandella utahensis]|uniref:PilZ domain-containing protein n=1 Tax=Vreelandella halophila TaxID=86177 RepID=UPI001C4E09BC|nr:PilZ domain-containing protein [Halomonas utahensis]
MSTQRDSSGITMHLADMPFALRREHRRRKQGRSEPSLTTSWAGQSDGSEQRIQPRFAAPGLSVRVRARRLLHWERQSRPVECLDINRYGVAILTEEALREGTYLRMDFRGEYITQSNVNGRVRSCVQEEDGHYRLGIQFTYCSMRGHYSRAIDNALSQIEAFCRRQMARYRR